MIINVQSCLYATTSNTSIIIVEFYFSETDSSVLQKVFFISYGINAMRESHHKITLNTIKGEIMRIRTTCVTITFDEFRTLFVICDAISKILQGWLTTIMMRISGECSVEQLVRIVINNFSFYCDYYYGLQCTTHVGYTQ